MALQPTTKPVPLFGGLDTKTDPKYVTPDHVLTAENVRYTGVQSAKKRFGQTQVSNQIGSVPTNLINTGKAVGARSNELLAFTGTNLYGYATGQNRWFDRGTLTETLVSADPVVQSNGSVHGIASILIDTIEMFAWEDTRGGVYYAARDAESGAFVIAPAVLSPTGTNPQIISCNNYVYVFFATSSELRAEQFLKDNLTRGSVASSVLRAGSVTTYAVTATQDSIMLGYSADGTNTSWRGYTPTLHLDTGAGAEYINGSYAPGSAAIALSYASYTHVSDWRAAFHETGTDHIRLLGDIYGVAGAGGQQTGTIALPAGAIVTNIKFSPSINLTDAVGQPIYIYYTYTLPSKKVCTVQARLRVRGGGDYFTIDSTEISSLYDVELASGGNLLNNSPYIVMRSPLTDIASNPSQQPSYYLVGGAPMTILQRFFGDNAYTAGTALPLISVTDTELFLGLAKRTALRADLHGTIYAQSGLFSVRFALPDTSATQVVEFADSALINCGSTYVYDGASLVESGFWQFPEGVGVTALGSGSGLSAGLYVYCVTYEWTDAAGRVHISAPSYPSPVVAGGTYGITVTAGQTTQITVPYLALTKRTGVSVCIYRTTVNSPGPFYKIATIPNLSDGTASYVYIDTASDVSISSQELLYAPPDGSGEIENDPPPPFSYMVATKTRAFGVAQDDPTALWYSKPLAPGRPVEWSAAQIVRIETAGGDVTALSFLDTQAVVFKRKRVYVLPGAGPNAAGQPANGFPATLQAVPATTGCINAKSVLSAAQGIFFESELGLELLDRSLRVSPDFGTPVQGLTSGLSLTGAVIVADQNQLRWSSAEGTALVYDYIVNRWSTYTNHAAVGYASWNNTVARLTSGGRVWYEDDSTYLDNGTPIIMTIETSWLKLAEIAQGFAAAWYATILGTYRSGHQLNIEIAYDYLDAPVQTVAWDATTYGTLGTFGSSATFGSDPVFGASRHVYSTPYQPRVALARQVCESVKFRIYDSLTTGASCDLNEIAILLGVIGGTNRVPASQRV